MFSILHISDLHRSRREPIDNTSLIAGLLADRDRYTSEFPQVLPPHAIVVSGDLVQGASIGGSDWQQSIADQYRVAEGFLQTLCDRVLDGDRSRLVLVPGNHDVCWNTSFGAMERVPAGEYPANLYDALAEPQSVYRWSWSEQALFRIADMPAYDRRLNCYWDFVESFYKDVEFPLPIDRTRGFQFFELCERRAIVAGFDSVAGNDCFNYCGMIRNGAIGKCALALRDAGRSYDLKIAVWHHGIQGPPSRTDYMDTSQVRELIAHGFQLGLHGHQHEAATLNQLVYLDQTQSMAVVSAGSLCAGARELPRGVNRQYNVIVIEDDFIHGRVHVREMGDGEQFTRKRNGAFLEGSVEVSWQPSTDSMGRGIDTRAENTRLATIHAEEALRNGRPQDAVQALREVDVSSASYGRKLLIEALVAQADWPRLVTLVQGSLVVEEIVILVLALLETNRFDESQASLDAAVDMDPATRSDLQDKIDSRKLLRQS